MNNSLLHINASIAQAVGATARAALLEDLAAQVIRVFEDSCRNEWLGQTIESLWREEMDLLGKGVMCGMEKLYLGFRVKICY